MVFSQSSGSRYIHKEIIMPKCIYSINNISCKTGLKHFKDLKIICDILQTIFEVLVIKTLKNNMLAKLREYLSILISIVCTWSMLIKSILTFSGICGVKMLESLFS